MHYVAPWWLPGGHAQTIWPALWSRPALPTERTAAVAYRRERWDTPDGDFIDLDWLRAQPSNTLLVLFHGLEGSSQSHYALAFAAWAQAHGLGFVVPHFRGCSGEINRAPRAYHSGDFEEIGWILQRNSALPPNETPTTSIGPVWRARKRCRIQPVSSKSPEW